MLFISFNFFLRDHIRFLFLFPVCQTVKLAAPVKASGVFLISFIIPNQMADIFDEIFGQ